MNYKHADEVKNSPLCIKFYFLGGTLNNDCLQSLFQDFAKGGGVKSIWSI